MNTCPWRENRPGLIIPEPRPAPEESLASVIIGKWCNTLYTPHWSVVTRAIVKSRTMGPGWPSQPFFQQLDDSGEKEEAAEEAAQREHNKSQREREQRQQRPEPLRSAGKMKRKNIDLTKYVFRRKPGQPEILDNKPGDIAPRARQWLAESVSAGVSCNVTKITLVTVMSSGLSWCWVTLRSCVTITSMWCCPKWRLQSTTPWSCGEYPVTQTQTSNLLLQNIFLSSTWTLLGGVEEAITADIYSFSWTQSGALSWINEWIMRVIRKILMRGASLKIVGVAFLNVTMRAIVTAASAIMALELFSQKMYLFKIIV